MDWILKDVKELLLIFHGVAVMKDSIFIFRRCMPASLEVKHAYHTGKC